ncbi:MAG: hypothetical protein M0020_05930 [Actinomycetota bacterium]|nr:hypothetical protein [Actinomycetota bacterium]
MRVLRTPDDCSRDPVAGDGAPFPGDTFEARARAGVGLAANDA